MKKKEIKELREKTVEELSRDVAVLKREIIELSHELKMGKSTASALLRTKKKNTARLLTIIGQMRLNPETPEKIKEKGEKIEKSELKEAKGEKKMKGETK